MLSGNIDKITQSQHETARLMRAIRWRVAWHTTFVAVAVGDTIYQLGRIGTRYGFPVRVSD